MSGLITVIRGGAKGAPKKAPTFFSRVDEAAKELPRTKGTGKEFMAELKKQPGVKKAELDDRKLSELESAPKMTKEEFIQKLEQKPAPKINESIKANPTDADLDEMAMKLIDDKADELTERKLGKRDRFNRYDWDDYKEGAIQYLKDYDYDKYLREAKRNIEENVGADFPKYEDYKLPGGENYREILLKLPGAKSEREIADANMKAFTDKVTKRLGFSGWDFDSMTPSELVEYEALNSAALKASTNPPAPYKSSHWDEPNVLAHIRVQDRVGPNGEKILHVEEIQSDWHQEGRKKGYRGDQKKTDWNDPEYVQARKRATELLNEYNSNNHRPDRQAEIEPMLREAQRAEREFVERNNRIGNMIPDAPFKKNWHELATKRIMDYAIQNGYDKVAITPGAEQASRYDLSKHIKKLRYFDEPGSESGVLHAYDLEGNNILNQSMTKSELENYIGKDAAQKLLAQQVEKNERTGYPSQKRTLAGVDLQVGGEGMIGFYDQILPAYINKEYGKYGVSIGKLPVETGKEMSRGLTGTDMIPSYTPTYTDLHSIDITPEMRETIQSKGQPLYQATGIGLTGAAAAPSEEKVKISDNPDTMMLELQDQGFAGGGLLKKAAKAIKGTQEVLPAAEREANLAKMLEDSAIKDRVYHSTNADIRKFSDTKLGKNTDRNASSESYAQTARVGHWFSTNPLGDSPEISKAGYTVDMPVYLSIKNPKREQSLDWLAQGLESKKGRAYRRELERQGYDGIVLPDEEFGGESWVAFRPEQIKSAIGNRGTYDVTDPDINKAVGGLARAKRK